MATTQDTTNGNTQPTPIEIIDLSTDSDEDDEILVEDDAGASDPVIAQSQPEDPRLSHMKCVICLDSPTNLTVTPCGHLFCHECLMSALVVTSPTAGNCPVCRRKVTVKSLVPLAILKGSPPVAEVVSTPDIQVSVPVVELASESTTSSRTANNGRSTRRKRPAPT